MTRQNSKVGLAGRFLQHVVPSVVRPIHALWNEVIGFLFIVLAIVAVPSTWRKVKIAADDPAGLFFAVISVGFVLLMAYFGVSSFRKARKISRS
jgi:uncharacterized membrane protein